jgi:hypothetical protein
MTAPDPNAEYRTLSEAFDHLNAALFAGSLPPVLITYQRERHTVGYYQQSAFTSRAESGEGPRLISEIALNPDLFPKRTDAEILSTLAHEMCHLWQATHGQPSRNRYHNAEWAARMLSIGLQPVRSDGRPGLTGQAMTHTIIADGAFDRAARRFLSDARLNWQSSELARSKTTTAVRKRASKTKFTCYGCGLNAWAKADAALMCAVCEERMWPDSLDDAAGDD